MPAVCICMPAVAPTVKHDVKHGTRATGMYAFQRVCMPFNGYVCLPTGMYASKAWYARKLPTGMYACSSACLHLQSVCVCACACACACVCIIHVIYVLYIYIYVCVCVCVCVCVYYLRPRSVCFRMPASRLRLTERVFYSYSRKLKTLRKFIL